MESGWLLQQDNKPKHNSKFTKDYLKRRKLKILPWVTKSPDLNIIESLWTDLKGAVHARQSKNVTELEAFCKEEWSKSPQKELEES